MGAQASGDGGRYGRRGRRAGAERGKVGERRRRRDVRRTRTAVPMGIGRVTNSARQIPGVSPRSLIPRFLDLLQASVLFNFLIVHRL